MKFAAVLVIVALSVSTVPLVRCLPAEVSLPSLATLDVCDSAGSGLQATPDIPFISECRCSLLQTGPDGRHAAPRITFRFFLITSLPERPPEV
ncbi:MAG: hypothetical protein M1497_00465 [Nitrospirae bacterium]|nr:hypothetical protein [Nitrospirota bacterium]